MNHNNFIISLFLLILLSFFIGCSKSEETICQFKTFEFVRDMDTLSSFMLTDVRIKYDSINDSTIIINSITDSLKTWKSNKKYYFRDTVGSGKYYGTKHDSIVSIIDSVYKEMKMKRINDLNINPKTKIILINPVGQNDTLRYEGEKKYGNITVYSFYYRYHGHDGDYRLYLSNNFGEIAFYSGAWKNITLLDRIYNSESLDKKWQNLKNELLKDSLFFPIPLDLINKQKFHYTPPLTENE